MSSTTASQHSHSSTSSPSHFSLPSYAVQGVTSLLRRLSTEPSDLSKSTSSLTDSSFTSNPSSAATMEGVYTPPHRTASPFQPPPLTPLSLKGYKSSTKDSHRLLNKSLAEEIRLLVPPRLQLVDDWQLVFSIAQSGVSLKTLYSLCEELRGKRGGYVLVVRDGTGGTFGAYLSDPPHPAPHFYGTGETFLWRAHTLPSIPDLSWLPPPPSEDTTNAQRMTTIRAPSTLTPPKSEGVSRSGTSTPERIRFKAFPYSGINDYMIFCEAGYLSVGGGDGHYGLWLDDNLDKGISSSCPTFGNEPLSDEGTKFSILGVELWSIGASS